MKILHFIESGGLYGAESVILNLSREMAANNVYTPVVGCIISSPEEQCALYDKALEYGIAAKKLVLRNAWLFIDIPTVARQLKRDKISLLHSHGYKPSVFGFFISLLTGIPIMATCHLWFLHGKAPLKMRVMVGLELLLYKFFPVVVAVSEPIKTILVSHGVAPDKIRVIKNGIVIGDYLDMNQKNIESLRAELKLQPRELCVVNIARLSRQKAQWHIITAANKILELGYRVKFFIVGDGPLREELTMQIQKNGVQGSVQLLGFRQDVKALLQVADIFLLPSLDEGMPMALLEATASKTPVVATPVGDIQKLIQSEYSGVLVKVDDPEDLVQCLEKIISSEKLRAFFSLNAFDAVKDSYSSKVMYEQYVKVYDVIFPE